MLGDDIQTVYRLQFGHRLQLYEENFARLMIQQAYFKGYEEYLTLPVSTLFLSLSLSLPLSLSLSLSLSAHTSHSYFSDHRHLHRHS